MKPFELQYASTNATATGNPISNPNVLKFIGVTSDYQQFPETPTIAFGIDAFGLATTPFFYSSDREIYIDVDNDNAFDYVMYLDSYGRASGLKIDNVYFTVLINLHTGEGFFEYPTNGLYSVQADTNAFNTSAVVMHVDAQDLGLAGSGKNPRTSFRYAVVTFDDNGDVVDQRGLFSYDMANPGLNVNIGLPGGEPAYFQDRPKTKIPVSYNGNAYQEQDAKGVLLLHMHNGRGMHSDVVKLLKPPITSFTPTSGPAGTRVTITGTNFNSGTRVFFSDGNGGLVEATNVVVTSDRTIIATVPQGAATGNITVANAVGSSTSAQKFTVTRVTSP